MNTRNSEYRLSSSKLLLFIVTISICVLFTSACEKKQAQAGGPPAIPVNISSAEYRDVPITAKAVGNIVPYSSVQVRSMITAEVLTAAFKPGDFVKKGQLLFQLDPRSFQAELARSEGQLAKDSAAAEIAQTQATRYASLFKEGVVAKEQRDTIQSTAVQMQAAIQADKADVQTAKINLQYTKIYSPINGRVGDVLVYPGNLIKANDAALVVINEISPIYVNFGVQERYLPEIKKHMAQGELRVQAFFPDASQPPADGKLVFVDNTVDPKTGMITLKASFPNTDHRLWPGQFVNVSMTLTTEKNAVTVPLQAVLAGQKGPYLYVVDMQKNVVQPRQVELGPQVENTQVIRSGVAVGETVVTDGQMRLVPGAKIINKNAGKAGDGTTKASR